MGDLFSDFAPQYEMLLFINESNKDLNGNRNGNILNFGISKNEFHPTEKPIILISYLIEKCSKNNDIVLDMFMGSGTTGICCKKLNRQFIGFEINKDYYDIAVDRIEKTQRGQTKWF